MYVCQQGYILTRDAVDYNQSTVSNTKSSSNFRREVHVSWWINQVDQESSTILVLLNESQIIFSQLIEQGDGAINKDNKSKPENTAIAKNENPYKGTTLQPSQQSTEHPNPTQHHPRQKDNYWCGRLSNIQGKLEWTWWWKHRCFTISELTLD